MQDRITDHRVSLSLPLDRVMSGDSSFGLGHILDTLTEHSDLLRLRGMKEDLERDLEAGEVVETGKDKDRQKGYGRDHAKK